MSNYKVYVQHTNQILKKKKKNLIIKTYVLLIKHIHELTVIILFSLYNIELSTS